MINTGISTAHENTFLTLSEKRVICVDVVNKLHIVLTVLEATVTQRDTTHETSRPAGSKQQG